jgi:hypothetical protein
VNASGSPYEEKCSFYLTGPSDPCFVQFQIHVANEHLQLEPIGVLFIVVFGLILVTQFIAMLFHRFGTLSHMLAKTKFVAEVGTINGSPQYHCVSGVKCHDVR